MIPSPGERPADWWENTGYSEAVLEQAARDGGLTGHDDPFESFLNGVPRPLAEEAMRRSRGQSEASSAAPWPLPTHPDVPTRVLACRDDRFFPLEFQHRIARERLGRDVEEVPGSHCVALSHPRQLSEALVQSLD